MDQANIILHLPKTSPERFAEFFVRYLASYEAARAANPGADMGQPDVVAANANSLSASMAAYTDQLVGVMMKNAVGELTKQAFSLGAGKFFPEVSIGNGMPGESAAAKVEPRQRVQVVERDPETLEITRTITK